MNNLLSQDFNSEFKRPNSRCLIEGGVPLVGTVKLSGARNSAIKLIPAAMFSNEDVVLENVPRVWDVFSLVDLVTKMGGKAEWTSLHRLVLNGAGLNTYEISEDSGVYYRVAALMVAPLVFRFGKAVIPRSLDARTGSRPINRLIDTWNSLGFKVTEDPAFLTIESGTLKGTDISFKVSTHSGTDNAIISSLFVPGETIINNAAEESEIEDLIEFVNLIGGDVTRVEPRRIKVIGKTVFKGARFEIQPDKNEAVAYATAALLTNGNISILDVNKTHIISFINTLTKIGCRYEFSGSELRVWSHGEEYSAVDVTTSPAPGLLSDWHPYITLLLTKASGESIVYDTVFYNRLGYVRDLNRMSAKIDLMTPAQAGLPLKISDDSYDVNKLGEPFTVARVNGPTKLKGVNLDLSEINSAPVLVLAALSAEGKSEISGFKNIDRIFDNFSEKLASLGARIYKAEG